MNMLKRNKIWVAFGVLVLVGSVALGFMAFRQSSANKRAREKLQNQKEDLERYVSGEAVPGGQWIERAEDLREQWQAELNTVRQFLLQRDKLIETYFTAPNEGITEGPLEGGMWKRVYERKRTELTERLDRVFPVSGGNPLIFQSYGTEWPESEEMREQEKRYWIQYYLVDALASLNQRWIEERAAATPMGGLAAQPGVDKAVVMTFEMFDFGTEPEQLIDPSHDDLFEPIPFSLTVGTTFPDVPVVVGALLSSEINMEITGLRVQRAVAGEQVVERGREERGEYEEDRRREMEREEEMRRQQEREEAMRREREAEEREERRPRRGEPRVGEGVIPSTLLESLREAYGGQIPQDVLERLTQQFLEAQRRLEEADEAYEAENYFQARQLYEMLYENRQRLTETQRRQVRDKLDAIERLEESGRLGGGIRRGGVRLPPDLVHVVIKGYVLDYTGAQEERESD